MKDVFNLNTFEKLLKGGQFNHSKYLYNLGNTISNYQKVINLILEKIDLKGHNNKVAILLANCHLLNKNYNKAIKYFNKAPDNFETNIGLAVSYACKGKHKTAYEILQKAYTFIGVDPDSFILISKFFESFGDKEFSLKCEANAELISYTFFHKYDALNKSKSLYNPQFICQPPDKLLNLYKTTMLTRPSNKPSPSENYSSEEYYDRYDTDNNSEKITNDTQQPKYYQNTLYQEFLKYYSSSKDLKEAFKSLTYIILEEERVYTTSRITTKNAIVSDKAFSVLICLANESLDESEEALNIDSSELLDLYKYIISEVPKNSNIHKELGHFYYKLKDYKEACKYLQKALKLNINNLNASEYLIKSKLKLNETTIAENLTVDYVNAYVKRNQGRLNRQQVLLKLILDNIINSEKDFAILIADIFLNEKPLDYNDYILLINPFYNNKLYKSASRILNYAIESFPSNKYELTSLYPGCVITSNENS